MDTNDMNAAAVTSGPEPRQKGTGRFLFLVIGLVIGVCVTAALVFVLTRIRSANGESVKLEGDGYETPEEAVLAYAEYLKAGDYAGIISTFAMESYEENYSVKEYYDRVRAFAPGIVNSGQLYVMLGDDSELTAAVNLENRRAYISAHVFRQSTIPMIAKVDDDELSRLFTDGTVYNITDDEKLDRVLDFLDSSPEFEDMEIGECLDISEINPDYTQMLDDFIKRKRKEWGGDIENVSLELEINGEDYVLCMTCVCYDDRWYNAEFGNYFILIGGISPQAGGLCPGELFDELKD